MILTVYERFHFYKDCHTHLVTTIYRDGLVYMACIIMTSIANICIGHLVPASYPKRCLYGRRTARSILIPCPPWLTSQHDESGPSICQIVCTVLGLASGYHRFAEVRVLPEDINFFANGSVGKWNDCVIIYYWGRRSTLRSGV
ncbi:hypothetical protein M405DRAFT_173408 [Rhizopogon salebrosus TDB-379]|nr:hypothetical protein M405DRAFT_173408 [Rhizopogon salebrosus TDB-379]